MLNQEKTGIYITEKRKQLGMTQKQLADQIGITDKAVSKWERGKSIPDYAVIEELCSILRISMNEFLSGEDIQEEYYSDKAEENIKGLIKESNTQKRSLKIVIVSLTIGFVLILLGSYAAFWGNYGLTGLTYFIDLPSFLFILGIVLVVLVLSGAVVDFIKVFAICFGKVNADKEQIYRSQKAVRTVLVSNILAGVFIFIGQFILILPEVSSVENMFTQLSVLLVTIWYSVFLDLILLPFFFRLRN